MKIKENIIAFGFILFITFPLLNKFIQILPDITGNENRQLSSFPVVGKDSLSTLPKKLENYFNDRVSIRNRLIELYNQLNIFVFHSSPTEIKAFAGKDGCYFLAGEELRAYNGNKALNDEQLKQLKQVLEDRQRALATHGAKMFVAIVPIKAVVYSDRLPDHIIKSEKGSMGEQVLAYLQKEGLPAIDLYQPLKEARKKADTYFMTDNHWNDWGAEVASNVILTELKKYFPRITVQDLNHELRKVPTPPGNIAKMLSIETKVKENNYVPPLLDNLKSKEWPLKKYKCPDNFAYCYEYQMIRTTENDSLPSVLLIRDSFGARFFPYFSEQCSKCVAIYDAWHYGLNEEIVKEEKPDVVVYLVLESNLEGFLMFK